MAAPVTQFDPESQKRELIHELIAALAMGVPGDGPVITAVPEIDTRHGL
jgi:hypothetical protein